MQHVALNITSSQNMIIIITSLVGIIVIMIFPTISEVQSSEKTFVTYNGTIVKNSE